ncbi:MAG: SDR family oxidoreductase [Solirubrobacterales bacterium]|nr:SDR family oxidoreductase [Solirubrobacterales bacterium]
MAGEAVSELAGRVAIVTGAAQARSIGRGIAISLAERGADVVINDIAHDEEAADRTAEIEALGRRSAYLPGDVADPSDCQRLVAETVSRLGRLDIFCANAGVARWQELADVTPEAFELIVAVNLHGCFFGCQAAAAQMRRQGDGGRIIVTSSVNAVMPHRTLGVYGATKHAVAHLVSVMAREWAADGITVNHVGPGWVQSNINDPSPDFATEEKRAAARASVPLEHRATEPREIGAAVAYFASPDARHTTGAFLRVDGGMVIGK